MEGRDRKKHLVLRQSYRNKQIEVRRCVDCGEKRVYRSQGTSSSFNSGWNVARARTSEEQE